MSRATASALIWVRSPREAFQGWRRGLTRNSEAGELLELFLVAAVCSVLGIRAFLAATGYPQIGGDGLHIAHMLWGGAFMLVAFILLFTFLGRAMDHLAAVLAGIGFGTFIDELGKFITSDNDYFYEPTIGLIYVIFVVIYLVLRTARRTRRVGPEDALANALRQVQASLVESPDTREKERILALLDHADPSHPLAAHLRAYVESSKPSPDAPAHFYFRFKEWTIGFFRRVAQHRRFSAVFPSLFLLWAVAQVVGLVFLVHAISGTTVESLSWAHYAQTVSMSAIVACVAIGMWAWRSNRGRSYRWYIRAALVSIFITQVFVFFDSQLVAVIGLTVNVLIYVSLTFMANLEDRCPDDRSGARTTAAGVRLWQTNGTRPRSGRYCRSCWPGARARACGPCRAAGTPSSSCPLIGERSLFQESLLRVAGMEGAALPRRWCAMRTIGFLVVSQARELGIELQETS